MDLQTRTHRCSHPDGRYCGVAAVVWGGDQGPLRLGFSSAAVDRSFSASLSQRSAEAAHNRTRCGCARPLGHLAKIFAATPPAVLFYPASVSFTWPTSLGAVTIVLAGPRPPRPPRLALDDGGDVPLRLDDAPGFVA